MVFVPFVGGGERRAANCGDVDSCCGLIGERRKVAGQGDRDGAPLAEGGTASVQAEAFWGFDELMPQCLVQRIKRMVDEKSATGLG